MIGEATNWGENMPEAAGWVQVHTEKPIDGYGSLKDFRTLKTMGRYKQGVAKIAKALKRKTGATSVMAAKRGVSLSMRG